MLKKMLVFSLALGGITTFNSVKAFEFPEKVPFGEVSANVNFATSYIWRGEVQNGNNPAIQGGLDYSIGLVDDYVSAYAGIWGSPAGNTDGNLELDYYGGISGAVPMLEDYLSYDGGILYYDYPGLGEHVAGSQDFIEYYGSLGIAVPFYDIGLSVYYGNSPNGYGANYGYDYINVGAEIPVPGTPFTAFGGFGSTGKEEAGQDGYQDYTAGLSFSAFGLDHSVYYSGTSGYSSNDTDGESGGGNHIVYTVGASF